MWGFAQSFSARLCRCVHVSVRVGAEYVRGTSVRLAYVYMSCLSVSICLSIYRSFYFSLYRCIIRFARLSADTVMVSDCRALYGVWCSGPLLSVSHHARLLFALSHTLQLRDAPSLAVFRQPHERAERGGGVCRDNGYELRHRVHGDLHHPACQSLTTVARGFAFVRSQFFPLPSTLYA